MCVHLTVIFILSPFLSRSCIIFLGFIFNLALIATHARQVEELWRGVGRGQERRGGATGG